MLLNIFYVLRLQIFNSSLLSVLTAGSQNFFSIDIMSGKQNPPAASSFEGKRPSREVSSEVSPDKPPPKVKALKIIVVGDPSIFVSICMTVIRLYFLFLAVGKTTLINRYVNGVFRAEYMETFGVDFAQKSLRWSDDLTLNLQLWDIAGQDRFRAMTRVFYRDAHGAIVMFDLTQERSFDGAALWKADIDEKCRMADGEKIPCLLVANKADLRHRAVSHERLEQFCNSGLFVGWAETSVKTNMRIDESIDFLAEHILERIRGLEQRMLIVPSLTSTGMPAKLHSNYPGGPVQETSTIKLSLSSQAEDMIKEGDDKKCPIC